MKRALLWMISVVLAACGVLMVAAALNERGPNLDFDLRIAETQDPKLRQILRAEQHQEEMELLKTRIAYITIASLEFAAAAFLIGRARFKATTVSRDISAR